VPASVPSVARSVRVLVDDETEVLPVGLVLATP
jgi:hypothetical protein